MKSTINILLIASYLLLAESRESNVYKGNEDLIFWPLPEFKPKISFDRYNTYNEMQRYLDNLARSYGNLVTLEYDGRSYEGRNLYLVKISANPKASNPIIFIDGGFHAREWISPAFVMYVINELVTNQKNSWLIRNIDWYVVPVVNPDGYEYSRKNKHSHWRKTRSCHANHCTGKCVGVDPNRNFDYKWGGVGTSDNHCHALYKGPTPFSESETSYLKDVILKHADRIKLYLTIHNYAQKIVYPWSWTFEAPYDKSELQELGEEAARAIYSFNGTKYQVAQTIHAIGPGAGGSDDWVKAVAKVKFSYTIELPENPVNNLHEKFYVMERNILPICKETFEGIKAFHKFIEAKYVYELV